METTQPKIIQICPFNGDTCFDKDRVGLAALADDGKLYLLHMDKRQQSKTTIYWDWKWSTLPLPDALSNDLISHAKTADRASRDS